VDIAEIALAAAIPVAMVLAVLAARYKRRPSPKPPDLGLDWDGKTHEHRFDTMLGDGAGWRCGICAIPREES